MALGRGVVWGFILLTVFNGMSASKQNNSLDEPQIKDDHLTFVAFLTSQDGGVVCVGTVVHESHVLTAAGCFHTETGDMISYQHKVLVGNDYKTIEQLLPHPSYRVQTAYYDIGLIRLTDKIRFGPAVTGIKLAVVEQLQVGVIMKTACWMMDDRRSWLKEETSNVIMRSLCGNMPAVVGLFITSTLVCTRVHNICEVNNGSPLYNGGKQYAVATKHDNGRTLFIKVDKVRPWIVNVLYGENMTEYFEV